MSFTAQQSRVDALIRLVGLIVLGFGLALIYLTYSNVSVLAPVISTVNYAVGALLLLTGVFAVVAKFK
ncbi:MAG: hypothetical protein HY296_00115 [Thaumarchaeota archaeon]|nr:hypothetical protein [Nitrososphaerota archaeon]